MAAISVSPPVRTHPWWLRMRALLAAALVVGLGATSTLAAWTDEAHAEATFEAAVIPAPTLTQECQIGRASCRERV